MTIVWGAMLAAGLLLAISPWVWPLNTATSRPAVEGPLHRLLQEAGLSHLSPRTLIVTSALSGLVAASVVWLLVPLPVLALLALCVGVIAPTVWLRSKAIKLRRVRRGLWPDVCDLLIASVRAGMSLPDAVASLADSAPTVLRPAFARFARSLAASGKFDDSMIELKRLLADPVADRIVETLRMTRQVGGTEVTTVLRALASSVRADATLRGEVEARQSWVRGAAVLGVVAPWAILAMLAMRPEGARAYGSPEGIVLIIAGVAASIVAFRIMVRIGRLPEPGRWFG